MNFILFLVLCVHTAVASHQIQSMYLPIYTTNGNWFDINNATETAIEEESNMDFVVYSGEKVLNSSNIGLFESSVSITLLQYNITNRLLFAFSNGNRFYRQREICIVTDCKNKTYFKIGNSGLFTFDNDQLNRSLFNNCDTKKVNLGLQTTFVATLIKDKLIDVTNEPSSVGWHPVNVYENVTSTYVRKGFAFYDHCYILPNDDKVICRAFNKRFEIEQFFVPCFSLKYKCGPNNLILNFENELSTTTIFNENLKVGIKHYSVHIASFFIILIICIYIVMVLYDHNIRLRCPFARQRINNEAIELQSMTRNDDDLPPRYSQSEAIELQIMTRNDDDLPPRYSQIFTDDVV